MRLLGPIILILLSTMDRLWNELAMCHAITSELIGHNFPGLSSMTTYQALEKPLCGSTIAPGQEKNVYDFAIPKALRGAGTPDQPLSTSNAAYC